MVHHFALKLQTASGLLPKTRKKGGKPVQESMVRYLPSIRTLTWLIFKPIDKRRDEDESILKNLVEGQLKLQTTVALARDFAEMIATGKSTTSLPG